VPKKKKDYKFIGLLAATLSSLGDNYDRKLFSIIL